MLLYLSLPPFICNLVLITSDGVTAPAAKAPAIPPDNKVDKKLLLPS
jgi:hypothetical protein